ncbi:MAG: Uma2 family endonuclease [Hyphomonadaceae bacterium]
MDGSVAQLPHRRFTSHDLARMVEAGLIDPDERIELLNGEIIEMGSEGEAHWNARAKLVNWLVRRLPESIMLAPDGPLRLSAENEPEPDFYLYPAAMNVNDVRGDSVLLVVEISDTSLSKDKLVKAPLYAAHGVQEYWIIDLTSRTTLVHRAPNAGAFSEPTAVGFDESLSAISAPGVSVKLNDVL